LWLSCGCTVNAARTCKIPRPLVRATMSYCHNSKHELVKLGVYEQNSYFERRVLLAKNWSTGQSFLALG
jgi:hypothetical protein